MESNKSNLTNTENCTVLINAGTLINASFKQTPGLPGPILNKRQGCVIKQGTSQESQNKRRTQGLEMFKIDKTLYITNLNMFSQLVFLFSQWACGGRSCPCLLFMCLRKCEKAHPCSHSLHLKGFKWVARCWYKLAQCLKNFEQLWHFHCGRSSALGGTAFDHPGCLH